MLIRVMHISNIHTQTLLKETTQHALAYKHNKVLGLLMIESFIYPVTSSFFSTENSAYLFRPIIIGYFHALTLFIYINLLIILIL